MNAIVLAILVMVGLSLARVSVVFALIVATLVGGLYAGMLAEFDSCPYRFYSSAGAAAAKADESSEA